MEEEAVAADEAQTSGAAVFFAGDNFKGLDFSGGAQMSAWRGDEGGE